MKPLIIHGADRHAMEISEIVERINRIEPTWNLLGFLAQPWEPQAGQRVNGYPVLGTVKEADRFPEAWFVPDNVRPVNVPHDRLVSICDPSAVVSRSARVGVGCVLYPNVFIGANAVLGDRVFVMAGSIINHDDVLADDVIVTSGVSLAGSVTVETGAYLGQACSIRQHTRIGARSMVGMGSIVVQDVPADIVAAGNPARKLRDKEKPA